MDLRETGRRGMSPDRQTPRPPLGFRRTAWPPWLWHWKGGKETHQDRPVSKPAAPPREGEQRSLPPAHTLGLCTGAVGYSRSPEPEDSSQEVLLRSEKWLLIPGRPCQAVNPRGCEPASSHNPEALLREAPASPLLIPGNLRVRAGSWLTQPLPRERAFWPHSG